MVEERNRDTIDVHLVVPSLPMSIIPVNLSSHDHVVVDTGMIFIYVL
jgi:hypothetical protein